MVFVFKTKTPPNERAEFFDRHLIFNKSVALDLIPNYLHHLDGLVVDSFFALIDISVLDKRTESVGDLVLGQRVGGGHRVDCGPEGGARFFSLDTVRLFKIAHCRKDQLVINALGLVDEGQLKKPACGVAQSGAYRIAHGVDPDLFVKLYAKEIDDRGKMSVTRKNDIGVGLAVGHSPLIDMVEHNEIGVILFVVRRGILGLDNEIGDLTDTRDLGAQRGIGKIGKEIDLVHAVFRGYLIVPRLVVGSFVMHAVKRDIPVLKIDKGNRFGHNADRCHLFEDTVKKSYYILLLS